MASPESPASSDVRALLRDGGLAGSWTLDPARSEVHLKTRAMWGLSPVHGVFREVAGTGTISAAGDVTGTVTVAAGSVDTKNSKRDEHLRSADFFDVANHPDFTFAVGSATPAGDGGVRITGSLTVRGSTCPVSFDAKVTAADGAGGEVRLDGEFPVNRADYGLTWNMLGMTSMRSTVAVHAVFTRQQADRQ